MSGPGLFVGFLQPTSVLEGLRVLTGVAGVGSESFLENRPPFPEGVAAGFSGRAWGGSGTGGDVHRRSVMRVYWIRSWLLR